MAVQPGSTPSAIPAAASVVGNAFVNQYYNVLHQSPHVVHCFYTDASRLSRAEAGPNGIVDTVVTQAGIHEKVMSLDYGDIRAEIKTVDSQESLSGSVLVMVTGALFSQSRLKRNFVQTFFLAPQKEGYFVLNDSFRYLDEDIQHVKPLPPIANGMSEPLSFSTSSQNQGEIEPLLPTEHESRDFGHPVSEEEVSAEACYDISEQVDAPEPEEEIEEEVVLICPEVLVAQGVVPIETVPPPVEEVIGEVSKKSYASIVRVPKDSSGAPYVAPPVAPTKAAPAQAERFTLPSPQPAQPASPSAVVNSTSVQLDESPAVDSEGDGRSVYVKNLPLSITVAQLEEGFAKYGQLKPHGVNLRNQKPGVCFAFLEFEEPISAQSAIEASPISIGGRQVYVEEKRPMAPRAGRGRFNQGRGYQNDGARGRGYFGGRGSGRGSSQDSERDFGWGRASGTGRGGYGGGNSYMSNNSGFNSNNVNGYRRSDSQSGNGPRLPRRGAGNQMGRNVPVNGTGSAVSAA